MSTPVQRVPGAPLSATESQVILNELQSEVSSEAAPLLQFILKHAGLIMAALGLFALVLAGTASYRWYMARDTAQAQNQLATLTMMPKGEEKLVALEAFVAKAPEKVRLAAMLELANAALGVNNYEKAANAFALLQSSDPAQPLGNISALNEAQTLMRVEKFDAALTALEKLYTVVTPDNRTLVASVLAEAAQAAGKNERAIAVYDELAASTTGPEADFFRFRAQALKNAKPVAK